MGRRLQPSNGSLVAVRVFVGVVCGFFIGTWSRDLLATCAPHVRGASGAGIGDLAPQRPPGCCGDVGGGGVAAAAGNVGGLGDYAVDDRVGPGGAAGSASGPQNFLFVGIMTAKKYLSNRVVAAYQTWASSIPGRVMFFCSEGAEIPDHPEIPVVALSGVDDTYPPQKKSMLMLKYMHDKFGDKFEWFMRADDDVYIKGDKLKALLHSINSSVPHFIGQAGIGTSEERDKLSLKENENFCMGGPGIVMSRTTLRMVVPHISYCLKNLYSTHEDVEIGRCVQKFAGISCTWAFEDPLTTEAETIVPSTSSPPKLTEVQADEAVSTAVIPLDDEDDIPSSQTSTMQQLFYQNHHDPKGSFNHSLKLKEVQTAITLHPFKNHTFQYRMHQHIAAVRATALRNKLLRLEREVRALGLLLGDAGGQGPRRTSGGASSSNTEGGGDLGLMPSLNKFRPRQRDHVLAWDFMKGRSVYSRSRINPKRAVESAYKAALDDMVTQLMLMINKNARQRGRTIDFKEVLYGYRRVNPLYGAGYIFDLLLIYRKHKGRRMTVPVRRHAYLQQAFLRLEWREEFPPVMPSPVPSTPSTPGASFLLQMMPKRLSDHFYNTGGGGGGGGGADRQGAPIHHVPTILNKTIHFIMPLAGRFQTFQAFMANFEEVCLRDPATSLVVMLFHSETDDRTEETVALVGQLHARYPRHDLRVVQVKGPFSRATALQQGSALFDQDALLFFIDVDIYLGADALYRIRANIVQHRQVYFPIVFSQYDPKMLCPNGDDRCDDLDGAGDPFSFRHDFGYWRQFGFGIAGLYKSDFDMTGGFDTSIMGWGKEDVDLFNRILASNLTVYRASDPGMVHIFHPINCDPSLEPAQYQMCLGTKVATYGSITRLAAQVSRTKEILQRNNGGDREAGEEGKEEAVAENNHFLVADA